MTRTHSRRTRASRTGLLLTTLVGGACSFGAAQAGVLQLATATNEISGVTTTSTDAVFEPTSGDIARNILASVGSQGAGGPGYFSTASAGVFGQIGLESGITTSIGTPAVFSEVLIGSDEFVNVSGRSGTVSSRFIIDGGQIRDFFSTDTRVTFNLQVGATVVTAQETDPALMENATRITAGFGSAGGFFADYLGGGYTAIYSTDGSANATLSTTFEGGLDLGATLDPTTRTVEIPFSLQSLELGVLGPGDRLLIGYLASFLIEVDGVTEGIVASFSDPLSLTGPALLASLEFTPDGTDNSVPLPGTLGLLLPVLVAWRRFRRCADLVR